MDGESVLGNFADELVEVAVQVLNHIGADGVRPLAAFPPIGDGGESRDSSLHTALGVGV